MKIKIEAAQRLVQANQLKVISDTVIQGLTKAGLSPKVKGDVIYLPRASVTMPKLKNIVAKASGGVVRSSKESYGGNFVDIADKAICSLGISASGDWYIKILKGE